MDILKMLDSIRLWFPIFSISDNEYIRNILSRSDGEALKSDWEAIGKDFETILPREKNGR